MTGEELRAALGVAGLRQAALSRVLGVSPNTVNRWVGGELRVPRYVEAYLELLARKEKQMASALFEDVA